MPGTVPRSGRVPSACTTTQYNTDLGERFCCYSTCPTAPVPGWPGTPSPPGRSSPGEARRPGPRPAGRASLSWSRAGPGRGTAGSGTRPSSPAARLGRPSAVKLGTVSCPIHWACTVEQGLLGETWDWVELMICCSPVCLTQSAE